MQYWLLGSHTRSRYYYNMYYGDIENYLFIIGPRWVVYHITTNVLTDVIADRGARIILFILIYIHWQPRGKTISNHVAVHHIIIQQRVVGRIRILLLFRLTDGEFFFFFLPFQERDL